MNRVRAVGGALLATAMFAASSFAHAAPIARGPNAPPRVVPTGPSDLLQYYGGRLISNVEVVAVFWTSNVNATRFVSPGFMLAIQCRIVSFALAMGQPDCEPV